MADYKVLGKTTSIQASSKTTIKIRDNFYSIELSESREIPDVEGVNLEMERRALFDEVNAEVDRQMQDIFAAFGKK